jgi:hypothetical protein
MLQLFRCLLTQKVKDSYNVREYFRAATHKIEITRGCDDSLLSYVIRPSVDPEALNSTMSIDDMLVARMAHGDTNAIYHHDN